MARSRCRDKAFHEEGGLSGNTA
ncbi:hypothetical protein PMI12_02551, partial [Variovorax sp. CF313]